MIDTLYESGLLKPGHLFRTGDFCGSAESDIEIGRELYVHFIHEAMSLPTQFHMPDDRPAEASERVVKEVEAHCALLPLGYREFNHYAPIAFLLGLHEEEADGLPGLDDALDRFGGAIEGRERGDPDSSRSDIAGWTALGAIGQVHPSLAAHSWAPEGSARHARSTNDIVAPVSGRPASRPTGW